MAPTISPNSATVALQALVTTLKTAADTASVSQRKLTSYTALFVLTASFSTPCNLCLPFSPWSSGSSGTVGRSGCLHREEQHIGCRSPRYCLITLSHQRTQQPTAYLASVLLRTESMGPAGSMRDLLVPLEWVRVPPPSPAEIAASLPADRDPESYWVVLRGREPGLYHNSYVFTCDISRRMIYIFFTG